ncbi:MAG: hypothetical protein J0L99_01865 [Chitinophagales bacterium]|nr:hypothetical protein [Chitinophagales bacterium]
MRKFILLFTTILLFGCDKEKELGDFFGSGTAECFKGFRMPFFEGVPAQNIQVVSFETDEFGPMRLVAGRNDYLFEAAIWQTAYTTTPSIVLNGDFPGRKLTFGIIDKRYHRNSNNLTGAFAFYLEKHTTQRYQGLEEMIDSSIQIGILPLSKKGFTADTSEQAQQKDFILNFFLGECGAPSSTVCISNVPEQSGLLECTKFEKNYIDDSIRYQINFRFDDVTMQTGQSFKLHDGNMFMDFKIPR